jgi:hypothetical protein
VLQVKIGRGYASVYARELESLTPAPVAEPMPAPVPAFKRGLTVASRVNSGTLTVGEVVTGESVGVHPSGRIAFRSTWSGVFDGTRLDAHDGREMYHYFRDGEINGTPQAMHGLSVKQFVTA